MHLLPPSLLLTLTVSAVTAAEQEPFSVPFFTSTPLNTSVSGEQWEALNRSVSGRLARGVPYAKPCFSHYEGRHVEVEDQACTYIRKSYQNETVRTSRPAGQINTQWETCQTRQESCLLDFHDPFDPASTISPHECRLGSVSPYYIDVREPSDIKAAFAFSRLTHVPLVVKNTGHDYKGRSSAPDTLGLWTHNLNEMTYSPNFTPAGCPASKAKSQPAVTLGAGVRWFEAYAFAQEHNVTLVGGADPTVGTTGGWLQGGGHGALSNTLGMGADRVLEFVAVTPDGITRTINACQNQDLFFALRGGGGGTFAVVLEATTLASPSMTIQAALVEIAIPDPSVSTARTRELWTILIANSLKWAREGWGAYVNANSALYINPVMGKEAASASIAPLVEFGKRIQKEDKEAGKEANPPANVVVQGEYDSWAHFYNVFAHDNSADLGEPLALASRLIPASSFETSGSRQELLDALIAAQVTAPGVRFLVTTPFNYPGEPGATAIHHAWRTSVFHVTLVATWNWNATLGEVEDRYDTVGKAIDNVRRITKEGAAYVNEADVYEPNHEETFWGEHYPKLLAIKNEYDPERLLDCWHCVGWNPASHRFSCYV